MKTVKLKINNSEARCVSNSLKRQGRFKEAFDLEADQRVLSGLKMILFGCETPHSILKFQSSEQKAL